MKKLVFILAFVFLGLVSTAQNFNTEKLKIDTVNFDVSYCYCDGDDAYIVVFICKSPCVFKESNTINMNAHISFKMGVGDIITFIYIPDKKILSEISRSDF